MGSSSSTQYPSSLLGGLFTSNNKAFSPTPYYNTSSAASNAYNDISNTNTNAVSTSPTYWDQAGNLVTQGQDAFGTASQAYGSAYNYLSDWLTQAYQIYNQGQNIYGQGQNVYGEGQNVYGYGQNIYNEGQNVYGQGQGVFDEGKNVYGQGQGIFSEGQNIYGQGQSLEKTLEPYALKALQQGFDPQNSLYNKLFQQQQDQSNAVNAMAGVATTPYGAGLTTAANQNFDIAWQQALLANEATAANTASQLYNTGYGAATAGYEAAGQGYNSLNQGYGSLNLGYGALNEGYGSAGQGYGYLNQGYGSAVSGLGAADLGYTAADTGLTSGVNTSAAGVSDYSSLLGAGSSVLSAGTGAVDSGFNAYSQQWQNQMAQELANAGLNQQQIQDYLAYLSQNTYNSAAQSASQTGSLNASTGLYGQNIYQNLNQEQLNNSAYSGLGSLFGNIAGAYISR